MKTVTRSAIYDGEAIHLEEEYPLKKNARLLVTVLASSEHVEEDLQEFREDWQRLAAQNLASAYGDDEPEYSLDMVKEPNPLYEAR